MSFSFIDLAKTSDRTTVEQSNDLPQYASINNAPIGIYDSGLGGLTVAQEVRNHLPDENIIYFADTANVPYGNKTNQQIRQYATFAVNWLQQQGCKLVIVACNSASASSLDHLRQHYGSKLPIIGLVPAVKPALLKTQSKVVAVLATAATFRGELMQQVIDSFAVPQQIEVIALQHPQLVPLIENNQQLSSECLNLLKQILDPAIAAGADHLVLGCTHYPFLRPAITSLYGDRLQLVDSGAAVARQTGRVLAQYQMNNAQTQATLSCYFSQNPSKNQVLSVQRQFDHIQVIAKI